MRKIVLGICCFIVFCFLNPQFAISKSFAEHCSSEYQKTQVCPENICQLGCASVDPQKGCVLACQPKKCSAIPGDQCPNEFCSVLEDCSSEKICRDQMSTGGLQCGNIAYSGQDIPCCSGLVKRCGVRFLDGTCDMEGRNSAYSLPICIPCGDGICGQFEDWCNCPEDCKYIPPPKGMKDLKRSSSVKPQVINGFEK